MDSRHEERISQLLGELRKNESNTTTVTKVSDSSGAQAGMSVCRDWDAAPFEEQSHDHPDGGSYTDKSDQSMPAKLAKKDWSETVWTDSSFLISDG